MNEAHEIVHQIKALFGVQQCTATQALGICLEFWIGAAVAVGAVKVRELVKFRDSMRAATLTGKKPKAAKQKPKKKPKKRCRKKR